MRDRRSSGLLPYTLAWIAGGAMVAVLLVVLLEDDSVTLPPVKETRLEEAAQTARCALREDATVAAFEPPIAGPRLAPPLQPGVYEEPERREAVVAALRAGTVVVHYRQDLDEAQVERLVELQEAVPEGTIVLPGESTMRYELAVSAWRHLLACMRFDDSAVDAVRLFRGRFIGRGPDTG